MSLFSLSPSPPIPVEQETCGQIIPFLEIFPGMSRLFRTLSGQRPPAPSAPCSSTTPLFCLAILPALCQDFGATCSFLPWGLVDRVLPVWKLPSFCLPLSVPLALLLTPYPLGLCGHLSFPEVPPSTLRPLPLEAHTAPCPSWPSPCPSSECVCQSL